VGIAKNCHLISVVSGKGGVGKSVFATNLAMSLAQTHKAPVLLMDLDSSTCGDLNILMGMKPERAIDDILNLKQAINPKNLRTIVPAHASGVYFIPGVLEANQTLSFNSSAISKFLKHISQFFKFIVVDLGSDIQPEHLKVLELSSAAMTVTTPDLLTTNQTRKFLNRMMSETLPIELFNLVINKINPNSLKPDAISKALALPAVGLIPQDDITCFGAMSKKSPFAFSSPRAPISQAYNALVRKISGGQLDKVKQMLSSKVQKSDDTSSSSSKDEGIDDDIQLKIQVHNALIQEMDLKKDVAGVGDDEKKLEELRQKTQMMVTKIVDQRAKGIDRDHRAKIIKDVLDEALGLGPLETLLADDTVTEIMVNGASKIFAEKNGRVSLSKSRFTSNQQLRTVIERIVTPLGRRIDEKTPYCDARLADGSRVNAVIEPLAIDGPALTIRKFSKDEITYKNYLQWGSMNQSMVDFLRICVEQGLNVIISGGTGSGKTTLLNTLSGFIPAYERIVTVEDAAELQLKQEHVVRLETKPPAMDGTGAVTIRDLVKNSLRMRPDRVIVGECRDGAALDMLQAMNTGHDGSMTTVHANTPKEAVGRLETLCLMAGMDLPAKAIREQVAGAVHMFVQIGRLSDGSRKVKQITEVGALRGEVIELQDIFVFKEEGFDKNRKIIGSFKWTGNMPKCVEDFARKGVNVPNSIFSSAQEANRSIKEAQDKIKPSHKPKLRPTLSKSPSSTPNPQRDLKKVSGGS
jgi:septum site-determining protein MinD